MRANLPWLVPAALCAGFVAFLFALPNSDQSFPDNFPTLSPDEAGPAPAADGPEVATLGSGCFWCTEAVFLELKGVQKVVSGYSGGHVPFPSYEHICTGTTGHAEVVQVTFDPQVVSYADLLEAFWRSHDPTTPDRQGHDVGPQYRSVIFTHSERQRELAEKYLAKINEANVFRRPVVTEIAAFQEFYPAEAEHQNYYARNRDRGYCRAVIGPKVDKLRAVFAGRVKGE